MTKIINLTKGESALVDDEDYEFLSENSWYCNCNGKKKYASRRERGTRNPVWMHRVITNAPSNMEVDHINGDGLDNRRENLRVCKTSQNRKNRDIFSNNKSGFPGVSYHKRARKWQALISVDGKRIYLVSFNTPEEASDIYQKAARDFFGEFLRKSG